MKVPKAKKTINKYLHETDGFYPIEKHQSTCEFASALSRIVHQRHAWIVFEDKKKAEKFILSIAEALSRAL